jgi:6-phosphogluconolactonase
VEVLVYPDAETVARRAAEFIVRQAQEAIALRSQFTLAMSGGSTPWRMLTWLVQSELPWEQVQIFQVDERILPVSDEGRNWTHLEQILRPHSALLADRVHPMPVNESNLESAAGRYASLLARVAGQPAVLDLVQLGLGTDGHTASLVAGDPVLSVVNRDVAITQPYQRHERMTLTYPAINRARQILWVAVGQEKKSAMARLLNGDNSIPAGRVRDDDATVMTDSAALGT